MTASVKPFRPLRRQVILRVVLLSTIFTLMMTAVLLTLQYREERANAQRQLRFAADSYAATLGNSLWDLDMPGAELQLDALRRFPMVGEVEVISAVGQRLAVGAPSNAEGIRAARQEAPLEVVLIRPGHPATSVGTLRLYPDQQAIVRRLLSDAGRILAAELLKGMALCLLISWLLSRMVTRHLAHLARHAATLTPSGLDQAVVLRRRGRHTEDELDQLCTAFNALNQGLSTYIRNQQRLEQDIRAHRDGLADMVAVRTRSLEQLKGFHGLVIAILTRLIDLPLAQVSAAIDEGLAVFGQYFAARQATLLMEEAVQGEFVVLNAWPSLTTQSPAVASAASPQRIARRLIPGAMLGDQAPEVLCVACTLAAGLSSDDSAAFTALARINTRDQRLALLCVSGLAGPMDADALGLLKLAARVAGNMLDHKTRQADLLDTQQTLHQAIAELDTLSRHDPLTGLANRRQFDTVREMEFERARRLGLPLAVLMCDIDQFKAYNDHFGHGQGDICLRVIAECLGELFNHAHQLPARLGGEEFAVLLPETTPAQALAAAEALRHAVWQRALAHPASSVAARVTISVGVAHLRSSHADFSQLLRAADAAMYRAKVARRNCVCVADEPLAESIEGPASTSL